jgi:hypothetical protein
MTRPVEEIASASVFPRAGQVTSRGTFTDVREEPQLGLTKREWFAGLALQGLLASPKGYNDVTYEGAARDAVVHADALIERLARPFSTTPVADDE